MMFFTIVALMCLLSFIISILMSAKIISDRRVLAFRLRNVVDGFMFFTRFILPFTPQPRLEVSNIMVVPIGLTILALGFLLEALALKQLREILFHKPAKRRLITNGVYGIVRHPLYLGESLWPIGLSLCFKALWALLLTPLWFIFYIITTYFEEKDLIKEFGEEYLEYRKKVKRFIPYIF